MVIVGICGGSGAGKSTVSKGLAKILPNAIFIDVDPYFREATEKLRDEIFEKIGCEQEEGVLDQNYYFASFDNMMKWIEVIKDYVSNRIEEAVTKLGAGKDFVIVDWCYLPMCDYFYKCDFTLCVKADYETRYKRLANRMKAVKSYSLERGPSFYEYQPKPFENRVRYSAIDEYGYQSRYEIVNDSDMESLNRSVKILADAIRCLENPKKKTNIEMTRSNVGSTSVRFPDYTVWGKGGPVTSRKGRGFLIAAEPQQQPMKGAVGQTFDFR